MKTSRQKDIRSYLAEHGSAQVEELAAHCGVATMTIRRDLADMEQAGELVRTHGGCRILSPLTRELSFSEKDLRNSAQKAAIAKEAVKLLGKGDSLFLDTGTTALHLARALPVDKGLKVFTNNLRVAMELFDRDGLEVMVYGGKLASRSPDLVGEAAIERLGCFRIGKAFVGADALDVAKGEFYAADIPSAQLSRMAQKQSEKVVLLLDSSKVGRMGMALVGKLGPGVTVISDPGAKSCFAAVKRMGAELLLADCLPAET